MRRLLVAALLTIVGVTGIVAIAEPVHAIVGGGPQLLAPEFGIQPGDTVTATFTGNEGGHDMYVVTQCYDYYTGAYIYAAYSEIVNHDAVVGPLASTLWTGQPAVCVLTAGWFRQAGFGEIFARCR